MHDPASPVRQPAAEPRFRLRRLLPLGVAAAVMAIVLGIGWQRELPLEGLIRHRAEIDAFIAAHRLAAIAGYAAIYVAMVSLSVPGAFLLTMIGGILFGSFVGALAAVVAATIGGTIIFLIARSACGAYLMRRGGPLMAKLATGFRANAFHYLLFLRLMPIFPFWLVSLAAALFGVPLALFAAATAIGVTPAVFAYSFMGAGLDGALAAQVKAYQACVAAATLPCQLHLDVTAALTPELLAALVALGMLALLPVAVRGLWARRHSTGSMG